MKRQQATLESIWNTKQKTNEATEKESVAAIRYLKKNYCVQIVLYKIYEKKMY